MVSAAGTRRAIKHIARDPVAWVLVSPAAWLVLFWGFILVAALVYGGWPRARHGFPGSPEYDNAGPDPDHFGPVAGLLLLGMMSLYITVPLGLAQSAIAIGLPRVRRPTWVYVAFLASTLLAYATVGLNPGDAFRWFMD